MLKHCAAITVTVALLAHLVIPAAAAGAVTGNPLADGWTYMGHSLANGVYVRGSANYGFDIYSTLVTVTSGSNLHIDDGDYSWLAGDAVLGLGGSFAGITADDAGWGALTGNAVNGILGADTKFVAKFGTEAATFSASTTAPGAGNGVGSTSAGGTGTVFVRSSGWFYASDWIAGSGILQTLDKADHISREGSARPDTRVARLMWDYDESAGHVSSWQILLNTSLLDRLSPTLAGVTPSAGDLAILSVQQRDSSYTDALVTLGGGDSPAVPEPMTMILGAMGLSSIAGFRRLRRK